MNDDPIYVVFHLNSQWAEREAQEVVGFVDSVFVDNTWSRIDDDDSHEMILSFEAPLLKSDQIYYDFFSALRYIFRKFDYLVPHFTQSVRVGSH